jgi:hypothetical protein
MTSLGSVFAGSILLCTISNILMIDAIVNGKMHLIVICESYIQCRIFRLQQT